VAGLLNFSSLLRGQLFISPIGGTPYEDWTIVNYVDLDPTGGVLDYRGGNYTYNGHNAIDFTLANFAAMDDGLPVYAAATGIVLNTHDGEFDRCSRVLPCGDAPNYVRIQHADGIITEYLHLKRNSISVRAGQTVAAGQQIAEVGSSGLSTDAHLHFAVYENGAAVETYLDPSRWWIEPVPYAGDVFGSLDHGISDHFPPTAELVNRPADHEVFQQADGAGQRAVLWAHLFGIDAGDVFDYYFYRPDGTQYAHFHYDPPQIRYGWWVVGIDLPSVPDLGTWTVDFRRNGLTLIADAFEVVTVLGDYNRNRTVDAADYVVWRKGFASGAYTQDDYNTWRANFGRTAAGAAAVPASLWPPAVPEPSTAGLFAIAIGGVIGTHLRRRCARHESQLKKSHEAGRRRLRSSCS
jgi:murein DD-endopeptidase MepM/ murein hydrolase activator NlpD